MDYVDMMNRLIYCYIYLYRLWLYIYLSFDELKMVLEYTNNIVVDLKANFEDMFRWFG
jgi:hypothetical protein